jgi:hypothetical protein
MGDAVAVDAGEERDGEPGIAVCSCIDRAAPR